MALYVLHCVDFMDKGVGSNLTSNAKAIDLPDPALKPIFRVPRMLRSGAVTVLFRVLTTIRACRTHLLGPSQGFPIVIYLIVTLIE